MRFLLLLLGFVFFVSSCASVPKEFVPQTSSVARGVFEAKTPSRHIGGFFSISPTNSVIDISSPLGFALYGIYINGNDLYVKDYMSGAKFTNADLEKFNIPKKDNIFLYENSLIYFTQNFFSICSQNNNQHIRIIECKNVANYRLPNIVEFINKDELLKLKMEKISIGSPSSLIKK